MDSTAEEGLLLLRPPVVVVVAVAAAGGGVLPLDIARYSSCCRCSGRLAAAAGSALKDSSSLLCRRGSTNYNLSSQDPGQKSSSTHDQGSAACIDLTCKWERILIYTHSTQSKHGHAYNTHSENARTRMHAHTDNICVFSYSIPSSSARTSSTITPHDFY